MPEDKVLEIFNSLPPEAQQEVLDFIAFLQQRYRTASRKQEKPKIPLKSTLFIGIWSDRKDMHDSSAWVRSIRAKEWGGSA